MIRTVWCPNCKMMVELLGDGEKQVCFHCRNEIKNRSKGGTPSLVQPEFDNEG